MSRLIIILLCLVGLRSGATDYFVDYVGGNDANAGTSTNAPFQHFKDDANWGGGNVLFAGDTVTFKGGVRYPITNGVLSIGGYKNGTAGSPIRIIGDSGWGAGKAIFDGLKSVNTAGTNTDGTIGVWERYSYPNLINIGGNYQIFQGFVITNFLTYGIIINGTVGVVITNCTINNGITNNVLNVMFNGLTNLCYGNGQAGINVGGNTNTIIVNCEISFTGQKGINQYAGSANPESGLVIVNSVFHHLQDDAIQAGAENYMVIDHNFIYAVTNGDNRIGAHADASQILQAGYGSLLVYTFNTLSNCAGGFFYEPNAANNNGLGAVFLTNVYVLANGSSYQLCTNGSWSAAALPTSSFRYNGSNYIIGQVFTANTNNAGYWNDVNHMGFLKNSRPNGKAYYVGNVSQKVAYQGVDAYDNLDEFWAFNNVFTNAGTISGSDVRDFQCYITNSYFYNNLYVDGGRTIPLIVTTDNVELNSHTTEHSGYNQYVVDGNLNYLYGVNTNLYGFRSVYPSLEQASITGAVTFASGTLKPTASAGTGMGTNLTAALPDLSRIPAQWRPDLSKTIDGVQRSAGAAWDVGAYSGTDTNLYCTVTVVGGTGGGTVVSNSWVAISTNAAYFTSWTGSVSNSALASTMAQATNNITVTANYGSAPATNFSTQGRLRIL